MKDLFSIRKLGLIVLIRLRTQRFSSLILVSHSFFALSCCLLMTAAAMDTDKIKIFGARVRVDGTGKLAELERAERVCHSSLPPNVSLTHMLENRKR